MDGLPAIAEFIQRVGIPTAALIAVVYGVARVVHWIGAEMIKPLMTDLVRPFFVRCTKFVDAAEALFQRQSDDIGDVRAALERVESRQREQLRTCQAVAEPTHAGKSGDSRADVPERQALTTIGIAS